MKLKTFYLFVLIAIVCGCNFKNFFKRKIEITFQYIINENWNNQANAIEINMMKLKKDSIIDLSNLNQTDILNRLEEDSSFNYVANIKYNSDSDTIYFNREYDFYWWTDKGNSNTKTIGDLKKEHWYKFSHLISNCFFVYVFIDRQNKSHIQNINLCNY